MAWINKTEPPKGKVGFGYMLRGAQLQVMSILSLLSHLRA